MTTKQSGLDYKI